MAEFTNRAKHRKRRKEKTPLQVAAANQNVGDSYWDKFQKYHGNIQLYAKDFFGITLSSKQLEVCEALMNDRFVCVRSAHSQGKSFLLGILINFFYDTTQPLVGIGTAPTKALVTGVMFNYARQFRQNVSADILSDDWRGTANPVIQSSPDHKFEGIVTSDPTSIHGRHGENVVLLIDEAVGVSAEMFEALESLMIGDNVYVLCIYNPTDPSSYVTKLEQSSGWTTITMSAYDHVNIWTGVERLQQGRKVTENLPFPGAINLEWFEQKLIQWSTRVSKEEYDESRDIILPSSILDDELVYYRPGPIASARLLGRWPDVSFNNVFTEYEINKARHMVLPAEPYDKVTIGVDVARFGSDFTSFCVRKGGRILNLFEVNGMSTTAVTTKVIELAKEIGETFEIPAKEIDIAVDSIGVGAGVCDQLRDAGYNVNDINVSERAWNPEEYANQRSELWFEVHELFLSGQVSTARIPSHIANELHKQLLAPQYTYDAKGRRRLEPKEGTKKRIDRSPDLADAVMLAFAVNSNFSNTMELVNLRDI